MVFQLPFTGVRNVNLAAPEPDADSIARRLRMAQMLQEQSSAPFEIQSYKGIQAPISSLSVLSKALKAYAGNRMEEKANEQKTALEGRERSDALDYMRGFRPSTNAPVPNFSDIPYAQEPDSLPPAAPQPSAPPMPLPPRSPGGTTDPRIDPTGRGLAAPQPQTVAPPQPVPAQKGLSYEEQIARIDEGLLSKNKYVRDAAQRQYDRLEDQRKIITIGSGDVAGRMQGDQFQSLFNNPKAPNLSSTFDPTTGAVISWGETATGVTPPVSTPVPGLQNDAPETPQYPAVTSPDDAKKYPNSQFLLRSDVNPPTVVNNPYYRGGR